MLFELLLTEWHLPAPNLVVSLVGEERPFAMKSWLRDILRKGLVKAAQSTGKALLGLGLPGLLPCLSLGGGSQISELQIHQRLSYTDEMNGTSGQHMCLFPHRCPAHTNAHPAGGVGVLSLSLQK